MASLEANVNHLDFDPSLIKEACSQVVIDPTDFDLRPTLTARTVHEGRLTSVWVYGYKSSQDSIDITVEAGLIKGDYDGINLNHGAAFRIVDENGVTDENENKMKVIYEQDIHEGKCMFKGLPTRQYKLTYVTDSEKQQLNEESILVRVEKDHQDEVWSDNGQHNRSAEEQRDTIWDWCAGKAKEGRVWMSNTLC